MEVEIHVSEEELAEFPEEATESTGIQEQSGKTSQVQKQGTVQSLLSIEAFPTLCLLRKIHKGYTRYAIRETPDILGGSLSQAKRPYPVVPCSTVTCHPPIANSIQATRTLAQSVVRLKARRSSVRP